MNGNVATKVFTMPSGVECEVREMTGKEQRILTEQDGKKFSDKLNAVLLSVVVRIGSKMTVSEADIKKLLSEDRKCILWECRMFSVGEDKFTFEYNYVDRNGKEQTLKMDVDLSDREQTKPYKTQYTELDAIEKEVMLTLPRSGKKVRFTLLDGEGESMGASMNRKQLSSHTPILMRRPVEFIRTNGGKTETPIKLDLDRLSIVDIEYLRKAIYEHEGKFPTEMKFEHPEADYKPVSERYVVTDLLGEVAFFFPSGRI